MKNCIKIIIGLFVSLLLSACSSDFLERNPLDEVSTETFWKNGDDAYTALLGVYSRMQPEPNVSTSLYSVTRYNLDCLTDNGYNRTNSEQVQLISQGNLLPITGGAIDDIYINGYRGISSCNVFLENIVDVDMDLATKNQYIGQVKFIRAWYYFNLQQFYGDVVIYETPPTIEESRIKQSSAQQVLELVHRDLDDAIASLPDAPYTGEVVKNSALALKAKAYLHNDQWAEAATLAGQVMASGNSSLFNDFTGLFLPGGQASNPDEILFSVKFLAPDNSHWYPIFVGWFSEPNPRQELVDAYQAIDGLPIDQSPLYDPDNPYANRDSRLLQTIQVAPWFIDGEEIQQETPATGFRVQKGIDATTGPIGYDIIDNIGDTDIILLRYADILLMYAEAQNEVVGPDQSVYDAVNAVRTRAGMPNLPAGLSQADMRNAIRLERRVELAFEGHRYWDLKRWGIIQDVLPLIDEPGQGVGGLNFEPHHMNWPFPQFEIDRNPELDQKDGY